MGCARMLFNWLYVIIMWPLVIVLESSKMSHLALLFVKNQLMCSWAYQMKQRNNEWKKERSTLGHAGVFAECPLLSTAENSQETQLFLHSTSLKAWWTSAGVTLGLNTRSVLEIGSNRVCLIFFWAKRVFWFFLNAPYLPRYHHHHPHLLPL